MAVSKSTTTKASDDLGLDEKIEAERAKKAQNLVGKLVQFWAPAPESGTDSEAFAKAAEKERREADPIAAIITGVQPNSDQDDIDEKRTIVHLQVFPPAGTSPSFNVRLVTKASDDDDGKAFCILQ